MSEYGLQVKNNSGDLIIDSKYKNFALYESGSVNLPGRTRTTITFATATAQNIVVALKPDTAGYVSIIAYTTSGGNYTGFILCSDANTTVYWKAYIAHYTSVSNPHGLLVYDSAGVLVYDSGRSYFNISSIQTGISVAGIQLYEVYTTITHTESSPYYVLSPIGFWIAGTVSPPHIYYWYIGIKQVDSTHCRVGWNLLYDASTPTNQSKGWNPSYDLFILK